MSRPIFVFGSMRRTASLMIWSGFAAPQIPVWVGALFVFGVGDWRGWGDTTTAVLLAVVVLAAYAGVALLWAQRPLCGADLLAVCPECSPHWCLPAHRAVPS